jgi:hypothetical protein|tara:strand:+ start:646 stop:1197 length:552 start_codon:yes stop_codon:yes gene_type:complete
MEILRKNLNMKYMRILALIFFTFAFYSCSSKEKDSEVLGKKTYEPNIDLRMKKQLEENGGIFSTGKKGSVGGNFEFASSNVLWRATLKTIDFMPLQSANYSGGLLITDWYSNSLANKESIKIEVRFFSNELSSNSLEVKSYKKICSSENSCQTKKGDSNFDFEVKNRILTEARKISLAESKKK